MKTIELQTRILAHLTETEEEELMVVINLYKEALDLLDGYVQLSYEECIEIITSMKFDFYSDMFGTEKTEGAFEGIPGSVYQSIFVKDVIRCVYNRVGGN